MRRLGRRVVGIAIVLAGASCSRNAARPAGPPCEFDVGESVFRSGVGAVVPARGETVSGHLDAPSSSAEITITTSKDRVVTITGSRDGEPITPETCVLP